jgi:aspartate racemase
MGVSKTVICCVTIHFLLPKLPDELKSRVISLLDVIFETVARKRDKSLLLCSSGTREMKLFESHPQWESLKDRIVAPSLSDQDLIHKFIYEIKKNADVPRGIPVIESLLDKYQVDSFIVGCTEVHIFAKQYMAANDNRARRNCIDPLSIIAKSMAGAVDEA